MLPVPFVHIKDQGKKVLYRKFRKSIKLHKTQKLFELWERENSMIEVTKINGVRVLVNPDLIELVEETPDTVLTLTTGKKIIVKESRQEIKNLVILYRKDIFAR